VLRRQTSRIVRGRQPWRVRRGWVSPETMRLSPWAPQHAQPDRPPATTAEVGECDIENTSSCCFEAPDDVAVSCGGEACVLLLPCRPWTRSLSARQPIMPRFTSRTLESRCIRLCTQKPLMPWLELGVGLGGSSYPRR
jgi:hypothetical protein